MYMYINSLSFHSVQVVRNRAHTGVNNGRLHVLVKLLMLNILIITMIAWSGVCIIQCKSILFKYLNLNEEIYVIP